MLAAARRLFNRTGRNARQFAGGRSGRRSFLVPSGPYAVGAAALELIDRERPAHLEADATGRRLQLKVWYPAERGTGGDEERIWEDVRGDAHAPALARAVLKCLRARTASRPNARFVARAPTSNVVVYNHGLISFAAENTSLMQELASHGSTVVAIQHAEQLAELTALRKAESAETKQADAELERQLVTVPRTKRPQLAVGYYRAATSTNRVVVERAIDTSYVLDRLDTVVAAIPGVRSQAVDTSSAHLVGFSAGGAVATEAAKRDFRARSVVNLDGGMHGTLDTVRVRQPYLMLYSSVNEGMNDELLPQHAQRWAPGGTTHLNYHDVAGLVPVLKLARLTGRTNPREFLEQRNRLVWDFQAFR
jgi:dienelactone hydrolase